MESTLIMTTFLFSCLTLHLVGIESVRVTVRGGSAETCTGTRHLSTHSGNIVTDGMTCWDMLWVWPAWPRWRLPSVNLMPTRLSLCGGTEAQREGCRLVGPEAPYKGAGAGLQVPGRRRSRGTGPAPVSPGGSHLTSQGHFPNKLWQFENSIEAESA